MKSKELATKDNLIVSVLKGTVVAVAVTLVLILLFALLIRFLAINDKFIFPVNQGIKVISLFVGMLALTKGNKERGLVKGILLGLAYFILSFIVFSILQGDFSLNMNNLYDLILTSLMGGFIGLIAVHIGK